MNERARRGRRLLPLAALLSLTCAPAAAQSSVDPAALLARAADADANGELSAGEWAAFLEGLEADPRGEVDPLRIARAALSLDTDGDGALTRADVEAALDGGRGFLALLVADVADADADGVVSAAERAALLAEVPADAGAPLPDALVLGWMRRAELAPPRDRNAVTAGVFLVGLRASLDVDASGTVTLEDLRALFAELDSGGDGAVDAAELAARRAGRRALGVGASEERPPARDRSAPCRIPWQRSLEDALAVQRRTGKPLLLCVNMDGENASEALAWGRYRDPAFAELAAGFVPLLASPDVHAPRERDDRGRRLPDPRFGRLVCSEHVDVEPTLFERYFRGQRVAPRHVGVAPDGTILFDLYLLQDLSLIDAKLREHGVVGTPLPEPASLDAVELLASPDAGARDELERRYVEGDEALRAQLAAVALSGAREVQHPELVRMALRDPSAEVRREALWCVARHLERAPLDALPLAFARAAEEPELRARLVAGLQRVAESSKDDARRARAAFLAGAFAGLLEDSLATDLERWRRELATSPAWTEEPARASHFDAAAATMDRLAALHAERPDDVETAVQLAAARARFARIFLVTGQDPTFLFEDTIAAARAAQALEPENARALALEAWARYMLSDFDAAAEVAARALGPMASRGSSPLGRQLLEVLAGTRTRQLYDAIAAQEPPEPSRVAQALFAHELLLSHPGADAEARFLAAADLFAALEARAEEASTIRRGLALLSVSPALHERLRAQLLRDDGARALEDAYEEPPLRAARNQHEAALDWYHGLATLVAAERDVQDRRPDLALATYARSLERFERAAALAPDYAGSAAHYRALAHAGRARILKEAANLEPAVEELLQAAALSPASFDSPDGLGHTPRATAADLRAALSRAGDERLASTLADALAAAGL